MILTRLLLAFIFVNFSNVAVSDDAPFNKMGPRKESLEGRFERMSQVLDLTDEQKLKIKEIFDSSSDQIQENGDKLKQNKLYIKALDPNHQDYQEELSRLSKETGELVAEQAMLHGNVRSRVNNELTEEQRKVAKDRSKIDRKDRDKKKRGLKGKKKRFKGESKHKPGMRKDKKRSKSY